MLISMRRYFKEKGQGIVEYAMLLAFIVAVAAYVFTGDNALKSEVKTAFSKTTSVMTQANQQ